MKKYLIKAKSPVAAYHLMRELCVHHGAEVLRHSQNAPEFILVEGDLDDLASDYIDTIEDANATVRGVDVEPLEKPILTASTAPDWHLRFIDHATPPDGVARRAVKYYCVDTGVDTSHPEPIGVKPLRPGDDNDDNGHGTHVYCLTASRNFGVCRDHIDGYAVKVLDQNGAGTIADVAAGLLDVLDHHAENPGHSVVNMSLTIESRGYDSQLFGVVGAMIDAGIHVVAAAGNNSTSLDDYGRENGSRWDHTFLPAEIGDVITVAAIAEGNFVPSFSNFGGLCDINAPGYQVWSARAGGGSVAMSGTSMASPLAAGVLCMMLSTMDVPATNRAGVVASKRKLLDVFTNRANADWWRPGHTDLVLSMEFYRAPYNPGGTGSKPAEPKPAEPKRKSRKNLALTVVAVVIALAIALANNA